MCERVFLQRMVATYLLALMEAGQSLREDWLPEGVGHRVAMLDEGGGLWEATAKERLHAQILGRMRDHGETGSEAGWTVDEEWLANYLKDRPDLAAHPGIFYCQGQKLNTGRIMCYHEPRPKRKAAPKPKPKKKPINYHRVIGERYTERKRGHKDLSYTLDLECGHHAYSATPNRKFARCRNGCTRER